LQTVIVCLHIVDIVGCGKVSLGENLQHALQLSLFPYCGKQIYNLSHASLVFGAAQNLLQHMVGQL